MTVANVVVLVAVTALVGCGSLPTQPDGGGPAGGVGPPPGGGTVAVGQIRGGVHDSVFRPLAGAVVEVLDGPQTGATATTDAKGEFVLTATVDASTRFGVTKDGYVTRVTTGWPCDVCPLRAWFHFFLQPLAQTVNLAGNYTLTFVADSACTGIPSALRTRTYAATIAPVPDPAPYPAGTFFEATAQDVPYWTDRNSIPIATAGDYVLFILTEDGSPYFVEEVAPGTYVDFNALIKLSVGYAGVSIDTLFSGVAEYWGPAVANPAHCDSANHRMILTRR